MTTEWKDLPTMQDVACAQADGWEIEWSSLGEEWSNWPSGAWYSNTLFRGRPRQPKMKKVKMLCWYQKGYLLSWAEEGVAREGDGYIRVPSEDKEIEVPE
jgi:hypothetical protein